MLSCHLLQRPSSTKTNPTSHAVPSHGFNPEPPKRSRTIDHASGEFCNFFHLVNYLIWNVALTFLLLQRPSSTNYIHYAPCHTLPWLQPNTKIMQRDNWPCKWWVLWMFIFLPLYILIWPSLHAIFCHAPHVWITNPTPCTPMASL